MARAVLDASAVLALLNEEPGCAEVAGVVSGAAISAVNVSEVVAKLIEVGVPPDGARRAVEMLALEVVEFDEESAYLAASLRPSTREAGLSLGDRACLALAVSRKAVAWTTDRAWRSVRAGVEIRCVRPPKA